MPLQGAALEWQSSAPARRLRRTRHATPSSLAGAPKRYSPFLALCLTPNLARVQALSLICELLLSTGLSQEVLSKPRVQPVTSSTQKMMMSLLNFILDQPSARKMPVAAGADSEAGSTAADRQGVGAHATEGDMRAARPAGEPEQATS